MVRYLLLTALIWYLLRGLGALWRPAGRLVERLRPYTRRLHAWVLSAPATFTYIALFVSTTAIQRAAPDRVIDLLTRLQSTNLHNLQHEPVAVLLVSGLWVADQGGGLLTYIAVFGTVIAWAERRYGTPRIILIGISGHVLGSLLTAVLEKGMIKHGLANDSLAHATDVGVSYVEMGCLCAAVLIMHGWWRWGGILVLSVLLLLPMIPKPSIWDVGHLLAAVCGLAMAAVTLLAGPLRTPPSLLPCLPAPAIAGRPESGGGGDRAGR